MNRLNSSFRRLVLRDLVKASGEPLLLLSKNTSLLSVKQSIQRCLQVDSLASVVYNGAHAGTHVRGNT